MNSTPSVGEAIPLSFLTPASTRPPGTAWVRAGVLSLAIHAVIAAVLVLVPWQATSPATRPPVLQAEVRHSMPLVAPITLTHKAPTPAKPTPEVRLQDLAPQPPTATPRRRFTPPPVQGQPHPAPAPLPSAPAPAPPKLDVGQTSVAQLGPGVSPQGLPIPPQIQTEEKPKLAFESVGKPKSSENGQSQQSGRLLPQRPIIDDAVRTVTRGQGGSGITLGDVNEIDIPDNPLAPPRPGRNGSNVTLLSDPMGVDFKPYLARVLAEVRRHWQDVIPESVRLGRRGRVTLQFAISRDGKVPKLVIVTPSGTEALDRAAVAGVSASNPFPPLPAEYKGEQVRLQFSFLYNMR